MSWLAMSLLTCRFALASADCAAVSAAWSDVGSSVPSLCPAVTCWPGLTATACTVPSAAKPTPAWCTGVSVPTSGSVAVT